MSSCPSKEKGGDLGWFKKGQMVAEFEAACFGNDPGTMVKVQTQFGWHLVSQTFCLILFGAIEVFLFRAVSCFFPRLFLYSWKILCCVVFGNIGDWVTIWPA